MKPTLTLITPTCTCCDQPSTLLPRDDLGRGLAVCQTSGQLYRPDGNGYNPTGLPDLAPDNRAAPSVRVDLSRSGYA